jgi:hypothetical protein
MGAAGAALVATWMWVFVSGGGVWHLGPVSVSVHGLDALVIQTLVLAIAAIALLPRLRRALSGVPGSIGGFLIFGTIASLLMTLGPDVQVHGRVIGTGIYELFYRYLPGFDGMRVPARFFMVTTVFLAALVGVAIAKMQDRWKRAGTAIGIAAAVLIAAEGYVRPFVTNGRLFVDHFDLTPRHLASANTLGPVYDRVRDLPVGVVLAEIPYGASPFDTLSVFYSGFHRKPLINGYSGFFPKSYNDRIPTLGWDPTEDRPAAWKTLTESGATHVVLHEAAYFDGKGERVSEWLRSSGAKELVANGTDRLFALK